jgi:alkylation response protein AidB-like acyl-CoA dehydrogenase
MEFALTPEQQQLKDGLRRYLDKAYSFEARRQQLKADEQFSALHWKAFAELGLLGIGVPEDFGGTGVVNNIGGTGSAAEDTMVVMECFGRSLVVEPYVPTVVLCGNVLRERGSRAQCEQLLTEMIAGNKIMALAAHERAGRYKTSYVATTARKDGDVYVLNGAKSAVLYGGTADTLIVSARTAGGVGEKNGISLFLIDRKVAHTAGLGVRSYATHDGLRAAELTLNDVRVSADALIGAPDTAFGTIESAIGYGIAALCAEAVGAMEALCEQTLEHLKNRKQFGVPIGTFQALQHRMVDMFIATEQARSITMLAALKVGATDSNERKRVLAAAKSLVGQSARLVGQQAVQLHGGMGVTEELPISHYFKRLTAIDMTFGDADYHRAQLGDLLAA